MKTRSVATAFCASAFGLALAAAPAASAESVWCLADVNWLVQIDSAAPETFMHAVPITNLDPGEVLVALDFRPRSGQLMSLGVMQVSPTANRGQLYRVDPRNGVATAVGAPFSTTLIPDASYGFDFNPTVDRIRVVSDGDSSFRLNPNDGTVSGTDTNLDEVTVAEEVVACAYDRNTESATQTTLFAIDLQMYELVRIGGVDGSPSPNGGVVTTIGSLGLVNGIESRSVGFDISPRTGTLFATMKSDGLSGLYAIDPNTGAATLVGPIGNGAQIFPGIAVAPTGTVVIGADKGRGQGAAPHVRVFDSLAGTLLHSFLAYDAGFKGGVRVAAGDVNGDGIADIVTGAGPGGGPHVKVFHGVSGAELFSFFAFADGFNGGVHVASGDVNGDGRADIIVGADKGKNSGAHVEVFSGVDLTVLHSFFAFGDGHKGGVFVASADFNHDGCDDMIVAPAKGKQAEVMIFDGPTGALMNAFQPFGDSFGGGVRVAAGDVNGDGVPDIVVGGGRRVRVFDGETLDPLPGAAGDFKPGQKGSVRVAMADVDGDGIPDVLTGSGAGKNAHVRVFDGLSGTQRLDSFFAFPGFEGFVGGITVGG